MQRKSFKRRHGEEWSGVNSNKERLKIFSLFMFSHTARICFYFICTITSNICMWRWQRRRLNVCHSFCSSKSTSLPACLPAPISICIYVRRQLNAALAAATSLLSLPLFLSLFIQLSWTLYVNMQIAARIFCTSLNRTVSCHVQCHQPNPLTPWSPPAPILPCCKRCSICNVNWTTAVAAMLTVECVPPSEIVHFSWKLNRKLQRILVNWKRYA